MSDSMQAINVGARLHHDYCGNKACVDEVVKINGDLISMKNVSGCCVCSNNGIRRWNTSFGQMRHDIDAGTVVMLSSDSVMHPAKLDIYDELWYQFNEK